MAINITTIVTSCGRPHLLEKTLASIREFTNLDDILVIEDGVVDPIEICAQYKCHLAVVGDRVGQVAAIDLAYSAVQTEFILHCEDDRPFTRGGFIDPSIAALQSDPNILIAHLAPFVDWTFAFLPGLRRMADYHRIGGNYSKLTAGMSNHVAERHLSMLYEDMGYRSIQLGDFCYHAGDFDKLHGLPEIVVTPSNALYIQDQLRATGAITSWRCRTGDYEHPGMAVARLMIGHDETAYVMLAPTMDELYSMLPPGLTPIENRLWPPQEVWSKR